MAQKLGSSFSRSFAGPVDQSSIYTNLDAAVKYAKSRLSYVGQIISVVDKELGTVDIYKINVDKSLSLVNQTVQVEIHDPLRFDEGGSSYMTIAHNLDCYPRVTVTEVIKDEEGTVTSEAEVEVNVVYLSKNAVRLDWIGDLEGYVTISK